MRTFKNIQKQEGVTPSHRVPLSVRHTRPVDENVRHVPVRSQPGVCDTNGSVRHVPEGVTPSRRLPPTTGLRRRLCTEGSVLRNTILMEGRQHALQTSVHKGRASGQQRTRADGLFFFGRGRVVVRPVHDSAHSTAEGVSARGMSPAHGRLLK